MATIQNLLGKTYQKQIIDPKKLDNFKNLFIKLYKDVDACATRPEKEGLENQQKGCFLSFLRDVLNKEYEVSQDHDRIDLVLHEGDSASSPISVIFEIKSSENKDEMVSDANLNVKALQELVLYYMKQRELEQTHIQYLVALDFNDMFIFPAETFETNFYKNKQMLNEFRKYKEKKLPLIQKTKEFYEKIASKYIAIAKLEYCHIPLRDYFTKYINDEAKMSELFKVFSPETLLKKTVANDSNALNRKFYDELLYILGLEEVKKRSTITIVRSGKQPASLIEKTISVLKDNDRNIVSNSRFGLTYNERLFNAALELNILWINRILFLKLLETQLFRYNGNNDIFKFLSPDTIRVFDDFNTLFFSVFGKESKDRDPYVDKEFGHLPYLNSSLFEKSTIEWDTITMANLKDNDGLLLPLMKGSVLITEKNRYLSLIEYLLKFLNAFDYSSDKSSITRRDDMLINASVLGLIFEQINGYKDGAVFTPGFITQYICSETIRRSVLDRFNEAYGWKCKSLNDIHWKIQNFGTTEDVEKANAIIDSIKILDPAVGSGHFLVSALNELIYIKSELGILIDKNKKSISRLEYPITVQNDELIVKGFTYNRKNKESQRIQETLFREKRRIIENCLFGVDINPNAVNICRLRLWIELLKNAYYNDNDVLETLPNIDINIKCGNSLVSKFSVGIGQSVKKVDSEEKTSDFRKRIKAYRKAVYDYKNENNKENKRNVEQQIDNIKNKIRCEALQLDLFDEGWNKKAEEEGIFSNSLEWMLEFPEVLDDEGRYQGFDVVIGNPPWGADMSKDLKAYLKNKFPEIDSSTPNSFAYFIGWGLRNYTSSLMFVLPDSVLIKDYKKTRELLSTNVRDVLWYQNSGVPKEERLFKDVEHDVCIVSLDKSNNSHVHLQTNNFETDRYVTNDESVVKTDVLKKEFDFIFNLKASQTEWTIVSKLLKYNPLSAIAQCHEGIHSGNVRAKLFIKGYKSHLKPLYYGGKAGDIIRPYVSERNDWYVDYRKSIKDTTKGEYASLRDERIFINPKIYITRTGNPFIAFYDEESYASNNFFSLQRKEYKDNTKENLLFLLPLINSKICQFFIRKFAAPRLGNSFIETKIFHLLKFPIPSATPSQQQPIIDLVDQILVAKKANPPQDTNALEQKIDLLVYKLYGLSYDEVQVIDPDTPITESEYNM